MGCWNETCMLSNLPIRSGEKVKAILVVEGLYPRGGEECGPNDAYAPISFVFSGEYNDYGGIENAIIDASTENLIKGHDYYIFDDHEYFPYKFSTLDELIRDISSGDMFLNKKKIRCTKTGVENISDEYQKVHLAMMHESLYVTLFEEFGARKPYGERDGIGKVIFANMAEAGEKYFQEEDSFFKFSDFAHIGSRLGVNIYELAAKAAKNNEELRTQTIENIAAQMIFETLLSYMRIGYFTLCGKGCQSNELYLNMVKSKWIINYCNEYKKKYECNINGLKESVYYN